MAQGSRSFLFQIFLGFTLSFVIAAPCAFAQAPPLSPPPPPTPPAMFDSMPPVSDPVTMPDQFDDPGGHEEQVPPSEESATLKPEPEPEPKPEPVPKQSGPLAKKYATINTSLGDITILLYARQAPLAVRNFIELAMGDKEFVDAKTSKKVRRPFYNGLIFHRAVQGFVIQTGCPFGTGRGGPGFTFKDEIDPALVHDKAGIVSMSNVGPNTNGSQFFITLGPAKDLDGKHTIFGEVVKGLNVVKKIGSAKTGPTDRPLKRIYLNSIEVYEK